MNLQLSEPAYQRFREQAVELGFPQMAAAPVAPIVNERRIRQWVESGYHADMRWFANNLEKRLDPRLVVPNAKSVIVTLTPYTANEVRLGPFKLARYAAGDDYHDVLIRPLRQLCDRLSQLVPGSNARAYVDTGPVLERYWAEQAGLGWIGKNGNLISRTFGSTVFLSAIITDIVVPYGVPHAPFCGSCRACLDACPTDAFPEPGLVDSNRCISYWSIEVRGPLPGGSELHDWVFGCDICQEVCPWTHKFAQPVLFDQFLPRPSYRELSQRELKDLTVDTFRNLFRKSPIKRSKHAGITRNINHLLSRQQ